VFKGAKACHLSYVTASCASDSGSTSHKAPSSPPQHRLPDRKPALPCPQLTLELNPSPFAGMTAQPSACHAGSSPALATPVTTSSAELAARRSRSMAAGRRAQQPQRRVGSAEQARVLSVGCLSLISSQAEGRACPAFACCFPLSLQSNSCKHRTGTSRACFKR